MAHEQALYGQDSRNQMLFAYDVFEGTDLQRESLRLLGMCYEHDDAHIIHTSPGFTLSLLNWKAGKGLPIFSLYWILAVCEYYERTKDASLVGEVRQEQLP